MQRPSLWVIFFVNLLLSLGFEAGYPSAGQAAEIIINLPSRTLSYYEDHQLVREYPVAIGKTSTPTPIGEYTIVQKEIDPAWYSPETPGLVIDSGPDNPLGYRWLGFYGNYGIHGTNAPWSIGSVISNGCIRMREADVEDLFPLVQPGTTVRITYDRIRLLVDQDGWVSVALYPDVYGYKELGIRDVKRALRKAGLGGWLEDSELRKILAAGSGERSKVAQFYQIIVNHQTLAEKGVVQNDTLYIPLAAVAGVLKSSLSWDEKHQLAYWQDRTVQTVLKDTTLYATLDEFTKVLGGRQVLDRSRHTLELSFPAIRFEGELVTVDLSQTSGEPLVPLLPVAKALGLKVNWDAGTGVFRLSCKMVPVEVIEGQPYLQAAKLSEYFHSKVVWDNEAETGELVSVQPLDYSMFLELMGDFRD